MTWDVVSSSTVVAMVAATWLTLALRVALLDVVLGSAIAARWIYTRLRGHHNA